MNPWCFCTLYLTMRRRKGEELWFCSFVDFCYIWFSKIYSSPLDLWKLKSLKFSKLGFVRGAWCVNSCDWLVVVEFRSLHQQAGASFFFETGRRLFLFRECWHHDLDYQKTILTRFKRDFFFKSSTSRLYGIFGLSF